MDKIEMLKENDYAEFYCGNLILNDVRENYIDTMVTDWAHIKQELQSSTCINRIMEFLLKIYYWSDLIEGSKEYWSEQIFLLYHDIPRQKGRKNRFPLKEKIFKAIWESYDDEDAINYKLCIRITNNTVYNELPKVNVDQNGLNFCEKYIWWLSEKLSVNGKVKENEVKEIINELMKAR